MQVLVVAPDSSLGTSAIVKITSVGRWSVFGEVIETVEEDVNHKKAPSMEASNQDEKCSPCAESCGTCTSSVVQETCACGTGGCGGTTMEEESVAPTQTVSQEDRSSRNMIGWLLRKRKNHVQRTAESEITSGFQKQELAGESKKSSWNLVDRVLLGGMLVSFLTIIALLVHLGLRIAAN